MHTFNPQRSLSRDVISQFDRVFRLVFKRNIADYESMYAAVDHHLAAVVRFQLNTVLQPRHSLSRLGQLARHLHRLTFDRLDFLQWYGELGSRLCVKQDPSDNRPHGLC